MMWAQLIRTRVKDGREEELRDLFDEIRGFEQADSGLLRTLVMRDQSDPAWLSVLVVFESEAKARAREDDPRRAEGLASARAKMAELFDGSPSFSDLVVVAEYTP